MNKIKNSFSKIKASDEFKDKLKRELSNNTQLKINAKKTYYISSIKVAAILLFVGVISFKLAMNNTYKKEISDTGSMTYASNDEDINNNSSSEFNQNDKSNLTNDNITEKNKNISNIQDNKNNFTGASSNITSKKINYNKEDISSQDNNNNNNNSHSDTTITSTVPNMNNNTNSLSQKTAVNSSQYVAPSNSDHKNNTPSEITALSSIMSNLDTTSVYIPKFQLPKVTEEKTAKMVPLIIYKENIYLHTSIIIDSKNVKNLLGKKLGITTNNINERSSKTEYSEEIVSNIGNADVYTVNGYDEDFRIMTNIRLEDGSNYPEIYECLNGITINTGEDFFGKLKLKGNIVNAKFQTFDDWNNSTGKFYSIGDFNLLNSFVQELNNSIPYLPENVESSLGDYRNNDGCKQIYLDLKDGSKNISFTLLKSGYIYYGGYPNVYFKISNDLANEIWDKLSVMSIY